MYIFFSEWCVRLAKQKQVFFDSCIWKEQYITVENIKQRVAWASSDEKILEEEFLTDNETKLKLEWWKEQRSQ